MYGSHDLETAIKIAHQKTAETGEEHVVLPDDDGKYTIGVPLKHISGKDFMNSLRKKEI